MQLKFDPINGFGFIPSAGGSQTPWTSDIDGAGFDLIGAGSGNFAGYLAIDQLIGHNDRVTYLNYNESGVVNIGDINNNYSGWFLSVDGENNFLDINSSGGTLSHTFDNGGGVIITYVPACQIFLSDQNIGLGISTNNTDCAIHLVSNDYGGPDYFEFGIRGSGSGNAFVNLNGITTGMLDIGDGNGALQSMQASNSFFSTVSDSTSGNPSAYDNEFVTIGANSTYNPGGQSLYFSYDQNNLLGYIGSLWPGNQWTDLELRAKNIKLTLNGGNLSTSNTVLDDGSGVSTFINIIDSGLTASQLVKTDTSKKLVSAVAGTDFIATVGNVRATAKAAAFTLAAYTVPAVDTSFLVSANILVTTATLHNFTCTATYTDESNTSRTLTLNFSTIAGAITPTIANAGGALPYEGVPLHIRCKASTTITIATIGTFTTVTYNIEERIIAV